jgi:glutathione synthase/RimK-type ligase-like ATP-grasp enzyme
MKLAIHVSSSTYSTFNDLWIDHCQKLNIPYKIVDCHKSDIIQQLADCDALMFHFYQASPKHFLFAKQLLYSVQAAGKKAFPDFNTCWHFDDKVGQKYLLEAINAPLIPTYVFYDKKEALDWAKNSVFPKVFKLRGGAGSDNVRLVRSRIYAERLIKKAFTRGFSQYDGWSNLKERIRKYKNEKTTLYDVFKGFIRLFYTTKYARIAGREMGYVYFQDFIPDNNCDIRIIVIGDKAFGIKRMVRENDFRASGSGMIKYEKENFDINTVQLSFEIAKKLNSQCIGFDFVYKNGTPLIAEISFGFIKEVYYPCVGYWDRDLSWHEGTFNAQAWMVDNLIRDLLRD